MAKPLATSHRKPAGYGLIGDIVVGLALGLNLLVRGVLVLALSVPLSLILVPFVLAGRSSPDCRWNWLCRPAWLLQPWSWLCRCWLRWPWLCWRWLR